ncbi:suppressor of fused domain protein [Brachybacterium tyrofermentans]|uniref:suppressor of fused domain protein n=1 Tax=Brachybacterium tyrofermentans TaxID=47848 RepID=UPI003F92DF3A
MDPTPHGTSHREALLAHLTEFLGDQYVIATDTTAPGSASGPDVSSELPAPIDLAVFAPSEQVPHATLVTLGLSESPMRTESVEEYRLELLMGLPAGWPGIDPPQPELLEAGANSWPLHLLRDTARIPGEDGSTLDWGHSITNLGTRYDPSAPFTGALIGPPYGYPPQLMNAPTPAGGVQILAVLPATDEELALRVSVPSGGDMVLDRLERAGVTAVLDPARESVTDGPAPWRLHVLLREPAEHLGQVLEGVLPNMAEQLGAQGIDEFVLPIGPEPLRWRVGGRFAPSALASDLALAALPEQELAALREAVGAHATVLTISPERPGGGATVAGAAAMALMLVEAGKADAIWLPHQRHLTTAAQFAADIAAELPTTCRPHPDPADDDAARTSGLAALGGAEVRFAAPGLSMTERIDRLHRMIADCVEEVGVVPTAGQQARVDGTTYELRLDAAAGTGTSTDAGTGPGVGSEVPEQVLQMVPISPR